MPSKMTSLLVTCFFLMCSIVHGVVGTGRMIVPPQRSSLWRDPIQKYNPQVVKNFEDHRLNCGGLWKQKQNDGRCGICGDPWDTPEPRPNEARGVHGLGVIGRTYFPSDRFINAMVNILSPMNGYFEFKLCPNNNVMKKVTQECLDKNPLKIYSQDRWTAYGTRFYPNLAPNKAANVSFALAIPNGMVCSQCVLQWKWRGGNNWGKCRNGSSATGCGPQEEFYNCADIAILGTGDSVPGNMRKAQSLLRKALTKKIAQANAARTPNSNSMTGNSAATLNGNTNGRNNRDPMKLIIPTQVVMSPTLRDGLKAISRQNLQSSAQANGAAFASKLGPLSLGMQGGTALQNKDSVSPLWASVFGRGKSPGMAWDPANMAPMFSQKIRQNYKGVGRNNIDDFVVASALNMLQGGQSVNKNATMKLPVFGNNNALATHLLDRASNPTNKAAEYLNIFSLLPLLRDDLAASRQAMNQLTAGNLAPGSPEMNNLAAFLKKFQNFTNNLDNRTKSDLPSTSGLQLPGYSRMSGTGMGPNSAPGSVQNLEMNPLLNQQTMPLGVNKPQQMFNPEMLMLASLLGSRSGQRTGGGEGSEGGRASRINPQMLLNPELSMMSSLLGRGLRGGGERSEGGQTQRGMPPLSPQIMAQASMLGRSRGGGEGSEGGRGPTGMNQQLMALSSLFGRGSRGGGEASEGGRGPTGLGQQLMGLSSLFGSGSRRGGEGSEGSPHSASRMPLPLSPELAIMSSLLGSGSGRGGEGSEGGEGRSGGRMSNLPLLAYMLGGSGASSQTGPMVATGLRNPMMQTQGMGLPGVRPFGKSPMPRKMPSLLNAALGQRIAMDPLAQMRMPSIRPKGLSVPQMALGAMGIRGQPLSSSPVMRTMRPGNQAGPTVSLLDLYRLTGGMTGSRRSPMID